MRLTFPWPSGARARERQMILPLGGLRPRRLDLGFVLYLVLHVAGLLATTLLMSWGLIVLFFIAIGGFSLDGMMNHLANLATRYLAADAGRIAGFKLLVGVVHLALAAAILFFRRHALRPRARRTGSPDHA